MSTLTDRYIFAVTSRLPDSLHAGTESSLRATIAEAVTAQSSLDPAAAERAALASLGDPRQLAARYRGPARQFIGPDLFPLWQRALILLLSVVPAVAALATVVASVFSSDAGSPGGILAGAVSSAIWAAAQVAFWVTLGFAVVDRSPGARARILRQPGVAAAWTPDHLPDLVGRRIPAAHSVAGIVAWGVLFGVASVAPNPTVMLGGTWTPLLTDAAYGGRWLVLVLLAGFVALEISKLVAGRWTPAVASANAALQTASCALVACALLSGSILTSAVADADRLPPIWRILVVVVTVAIGTSDVARGFALARRPASLR